jgi:hypothetical protein
MSDRIIHKRSFTPNAIPTTASLDFGELAINVNDGKLFIRQSGSLGDAIVSPKSHIIISGSISAEVNSTDDIFIIKSSSVDYFKINNDGAVTIQTNAYDAFLIKNLYGNDILKVNNGGILVLATQSVELTDPAPAGALYFTSSSFFIGLDH